MYAFLQFCLLLVVFSISCHSSKLGLLDDIDDGRIWDFRVEVQAGMVDCYYQKIRPGEVVTADFDVLGDKDYGQHGKISFSVSNEDKGHVLYNIENVAVGDFYDESQIESKTEALYKFCINNTMDPDSYKHVHVHFVAYLYVNTRGWGKFHEEIERLMIQSEIFSASVERVQDNLVTANSIISHSKSRENRDFLLGETKRSLVTVWSLMNCIWIFGAFVTQVYFIRKLFENNPNP